MPQMLGWETSTCRSWWNCFRLICDLTIHVQYFFCIFTSLISSFINWSILHPPFMTIQLLSSKNDFGLKTPWNNRALTPPWCRFQRPQLHLGMHHQGRHRLGHDRNPPRPQKCYVIINAMTMVEISVRASLFLLCWWSTRKLRDIYVVWDWRYVMIGYLQRFFEIGIRQNHPLHQRHFDIDHSKT